MGLPPSPVAALRAGFLVDSSFGEHGPDLAHVPATCGGDCPGSTLQMVMAVAELQACYSNSSQVGHAKRSGRLQHGVVR